MDEQSDKAPARHANGQFGPGNPGRARGARGRMTQRIALSLLRHYEENQAQILSTFTSHRNMPAFMRMFDRMMSREMCDEGPDLAALPAEEAVRVTGAVRIALERVEAGKGSLADIEAALDGVVRREDRPDIR